MGLQMIHEADLKRLSYKAPDYTQLNEKEFIQVLKDIKTTEELEGLGNRRKWLNNHHLQTWSDWQREAIINRKWELEHGG